MYKQPTALFNPDKNESSKCNSEFLNKIYSTRYSYSINSLLAYAMLLNIL